ncbi:MAG: DUF5615 family PIN-like protein [Bryobacteraceae bacterium]
MKLLFDENLSRKLVVRLGELYPEPAHVAEAGLLESPDRGIWEFAKAGTSSSWAPAPILRTRHNDRAASQGSVASALDAPGEGRRGGYCGARPSESRNSRPTPNSASWFRTATSAPGASREAVTRRLIGGTAGVVGFSLASGCFRLQ